MAGISFGQKQKQAVYQSGFSILKITTLKLTDMKTLITVILILAGCLIGILLIAKLAGEKMQLATWKEIKNNFKQLKTKQ